MTGKGVKRGPGRPRKVPSLADSHPLDDFLDAEEAPPKRKPGRPRSLPVVGAVKKKRGRPRKNSLPEDSSPQAPKKKKRGRPPKVPRPDTPPSPDDEEEEVDEHEEIQAIARAVGGKAFHLRSSVAVGGKAFNAESSPEEAPPSPTYEEFSNSLLSSGKLNIHGEPSNETDHDTTDDDFDEYKQDASEDDEKKKAATEDEEDIEEDEKDIEENEKDIEEDEKDIEEDEKDIEEDEKEEVEEDPASDASPVSPKKRKNQRASPNEQKCVCNWGEECARFRRYFDRCLEREGFCVYAGTFRPNIRGGERQGNFLDAVDRHLCTDPDTRKKKNGRYVIAYHHWTKPVLDYLKKMKAQRTLLVPVSNKVAADLGLNNDPLDEYQKTVVPDEYGRLRPMRERDTLSSSSDGTESENENESKKWVMAPNHSYTDVKAIVDAGISLEINQRYAENLRKTREKKAQIPVTAAAAQPAADSGEIDSGEMERTIATLRAASVEKDARIAEKDASIAQKDACIAEKDTSISQKDARIKELSLEVEHLKDDIQAIKVQFKLLSNAVRKSEA